MTGVSGAGDVEAVAARCLGLLRERGETVATAESLTGGLVAATLADVPGASYALRGGLVAYATEVKIDVLGVDSSLVDEHGVVSEECALAMAQRARRLLDSTYAVSTTGVAGPEAQEGKPVGTVYIAVAGDSFAQARGLALSGGRHEIRHSTVSEALRLVEFVLSGMSPLGADRSR
jgi:PncC family amidohydrolase